MELNCLLLVPHSQVITLNVSDNTKVYYLKEKIKSAYTPDLDSVATPNLLLYSLKDQDVNEEDVSQILANPNLYLQNPLLSLQTVAECFPTIPDKKIHILIRLPGTSSSVDIDPCVSGVPGVSSFLFSLHIDILIKFVPETSRQDLGEPQANPRRRGFVSSTSCPSYLCSY